VRRAPLATRVPRERRARGATPDLKELPEHRAAQEHAARPEHRGFPAVLALSVPKGSPARGGHRDSRAPKAEPELRGPKA
jgi:hypothetical protein